MTNLNQFQGIFDAVTDPGAVENRLAIVKADGSFDLVIIDPYGRIKALASYPEGGEATLVANIPGKWDYVHQAWGLDRLAGTGKDGIFYLWRKMA